MAADPTSSAPLRGRLGALRSHLQRWLFPADRAKRSELSKWQRLGAGLGLLALAITLQLLRIGLSDGLHSLWAEDGQIFFQGAISMGFLHDLFETYAGYLVVVPRLVGEVGNLVPLRDAPAAIAIAAGTVVALSGLAVWVGAAAHISDPYLRGSLVAVTILTPVGGLESVASGAYVPWYMLFATFWLLLWRPASTRSALLGSLFILATGLSSPGVWFFAPLALLRGIAARDRRDWMIFGSWALGAAIQVPVIALNSETAVQPAWSNDIWTAFVQRVVDGAVFGERVGGIAWAYLGWPFLIVLVGALLACLRVGVSRSTPTARYLAAIAIPTSLVMFAASVYQRAVGGQVMWLAGGHSDNGGRYVIVPALLLISVALVLIDQSPEWRRWPSRLPRAGTTVATVLLLSVLASFYVRDTAARGTPPWDQALETAAATCASEKAETTTVPTSPAGFGVAIPCDRLSSIGGEHAR